MPHDTNRPDDTSFANNTRSFTNGGITTTSNHKSNGGSLGSGFGTTNTVWGASSNIWSDNPGNGISHFKHPSRPLPRDSSASREGATQDSTNGPGVIERQTGANSLADSSVKDAWSFKNNAAAQRSLPSARSVSYNDSAEAFGFQQRRASNMGTSSSLSIALPMNVPTWAGKPPPVNLSATSSMYPRTAWGSSFSNGTANRGAEQPPTVYTKFDRPVDPNARTSESTDGSALSGYSPTDTRKSAFSAQTSNRNLSQATSRDSSNQPSTLHTPLFAYPDYTLASSRPTQSSSRAPSISSQYNGDLNAIHADLDEVTKQLHEFTVLGYSRPAPVPRPLNSSNGSWSSQTALATNGVPLTRTYWHSLDLSADFADESNNLPRPSFADFGQDRSAHISNVTPGSNSATFRLRGSVPHTPNAPVFTPGQPYMGALPFSDSSEPPRTDLYGFGPSGLPSYGNRGSLMPDQAYMIEPRTNQVVLGPQPPVDFANFHLTGPIIYNEVPIRTPGNLSQHEDALPQEGVQSALMYEFRSNPRGRRYELKDIYHHIAEFSGDQHGSRFIQTKLETANSDEKEMVFRELEPNALALMIDVFGNYVIQKFFEHGDQLQKKMLASKMRGRVLELSRSMYGCRVVQKALDVVLVDQQAEIISELRGYVIPCVQDQNGNHVIQKAIEKCRPEHIGFIFAAFKGEVRALSTHAYGCRVIQRCLERCEDQNKRDIMMELMDGIEGMVMDSFGNYVVQHIVQHDQGESRRRVLDMVAKNLEIYSKHKFASNVVEMCLKHADDTWKRNIWLAIVRAPTKAPGAEGDGLFIGLIKDLFGNYVIQKLLDELGPEDYHQFVDYLQPALVHAKRTGGCSCTKQVQVIDKKLQDRAKKDRDEQTKRGLANGVYNPNAYRAPIGPPQWRNNNSATHTPSPPPPHHFRVAPQNMPSTHMNGHLNGDAGAGASNGHPGRRSNGYSNDGFTRQ